MFGWSPITLEAHTYSLSLSLSRSLYSNSPTALWYLGLHVIRMHLINVPDRKKNKKCKKRWCTAPASGPATFIGSQPAFFCRVKSFCFFHPYILFFFFLQFYRLLPPIFVVCLVVTFERKKNIWAPCVEETACLELETNFWGYEERYYMWSWIFLKIRTSFISRIEGRWIKWSYYDGFFWLFWPPNNGLELEVYCSVVRTTVKMFSCFHLVRLLNK